MNRFFENVGAAIGLGPQDEDMPWTEAPRSVLEHFNRGKMKGIDDVGYFIYQGCRVYEDGKHDEALGRDLLSPEERSKLERK